MRTEQLTKCFEPLRELRARLCTRLTGLSPRNIDLPKAVLLVWFSVFACSGVSFCTVFTFRVAYACSNALVTCENFKTSKSHIMSVRMPYIKKQPKLNV